MAAAAKTEGPPRCPLCGGECVPANDGSKWCHECWDKMLVLAAAAMAGNESGTQTILDRAVSVLLALMAASKEKPNG